MLVGKGEVNMTKFTPTMLLSPSFTDLMSTGIDKPISGGLNKPSFTSIHCRSEPEKIKEILASSFHL